MQRDAIWHIEAEERRRMQGRQGIMRQSMNTAEELQQEMLARKDKAKQIVEQTVDENLELRQKVNELKLEL